MIIADHKILSDADWSNLHGNDTFVAMLKNKLFVEIEKVTGISASVDGSDESTDLILDYLREVPDELVYYTIERIYGMTRMEIYFLNPVDKENFYHYYRTQVGLDKISE